MEQSGNLLRFLDTRKGNFFSNQETKSLLSWWSFFFLLVTLKFDSWVKVEGEIRC